jgi:hypothetical protein
MATTSVVMNADPQQRRKGRPMDRRIAAGAAGLAAAATPALASAADVSSPEGMIGVGLGACTLMAAVVLLVAALGLGKVAEGSAMADNVRWVMLGALCLAGHVLVLWIATFLPAGTIGESQARLGSDALVILGLVFLSVYFMRVRIALGGFAKRAAADAAAMIAQAEAMGAGTSDPAPAVSLAAAAVDAEVPEIAAAAVDDGAEEG